MTDKGDTDLDTDEKTDCYTFSRVKSEPMDLSDGGVEQIATSELEPVEGPPTSLGPIKLEARELADVTQILVNAQKPLNFGRSWNDGLDEKPSCSSLVEEAVDPSPTDDIIEPAETTGNDLGGIRVEFNQSSGEESERDESEQVTLHYCDVCGELFKSLHTLDRHRKLHDGMMKCVICPAIFQRTSVSVRMYFEHLQRCVRNVGRNRLHGAFRCDICLHVCEDLSSYNSHILHHLADDSRKDNAVFCVFCGQSLNRRMKRIIHHCEGCQSFTKLNVRFGLRCYLCDETFEDKNDLLQHSIAVHICCQGQEVALTGATHSARSRTALPNEVTDIAASYETESDDGQPEFPTVHPLGKPVSTYMGSTTFEAVRLVVNCTFCQKKMQKQTVENGFIILEHVSNCAVRELMGEKLTCPVCSMVFMRLHMIVIHVLQEHMCVIPRPYVNSKNFVEAGMELHNWQCNYIMQYLKYNSYVSLESRSNRDLNCPSCQLTFLDLGKDFIYHAYQCVTYSGQCSIAGCSVGLEFTNTHALMKHVLLDHCNLKSENEYRTVNAWFSFVKADDGPFKPEFVCPFCSSTFDLRKLNQIDVVCHVSYCAKKIWRRYDCPICDKILPNLQAVIRHSYVHVLPELDDFLMAEKRDPNLRKLLEIICKARDSRACLTNETTNQNSSATGNSYFVVEKVDETDITDLVSVDDPVSSVGVYLEAGRRSPSEQPSTSNFIPSTASAHTFPCILCGIEFDIVDGDLPRLDIAAHVLECARRVPAENGFQSCDLCDDKSFSAAENGLAVHALEYHMGIEDSLQLSFESKPGTSTPDAISSFRAERGPKKRPRASKKRCIFCKIDHHAGKTCFGLIKHVCKCKQLLQNDRGGYDCPSCHRGSKTFKDKRDLVRHALEHHMKVATRTETRNCRRTCSGIIKTRNTLIDSLAGSNDVETIISGYDVYFAEVGGNFRCKGCDLEFKAGVLLLKHMPLCRGLANYDASVNARMRITGQSNASNFITSTASANAIPCILCGIKFDIVDGDLPRMDIAAHVLECAKRTPAENGFQSCLLCDDDDDDDSFSAAENGLAVHVLEFHMGIEDSLQLLSESNPGKSTHDAISSFRAKRAPKKRRVTGPEALASISFAKTAHSEVRCIFCESAHYAGKTCFRLIKHVCKCNRLLQNDRGGYDCPSCPRGVKTFKEKRDLVRHALHDHMQVATRTDENNRRRTCSDIIKTRNTLIDSLAGSSNVKTAISGNDVYFAEVDGNFRCKDCDFEFKVGGSLLKHLPLCQGPGRGSSNVKTVMSGCDVYLAEVDGNFRCKDCDFEFKVGGSLLKHLPLCQGPGGGSELDKSLSMPGSEPSANYPNPNQPKNDVHSTADTSGRTVQCFRCRMTLPLDSASVNLPAIEHVCGCVQEDPMDQLTCRECSLEVTVSFESFVDYVNHILNEHMGIKTVDDDDDTIVTGDSLVVASLAQRRRALVSQTFADYDASDARMRITGKSNAPYQCTKCQSFFRKESTFLVHRSKGCNSVRRDILRCLCGFIPFPKKGILLVHISQCKQYIEADPEKKKALEARLPLTAVKCECERWYIGRARLRAHWNSCRFRRQKQD